MGRHPDWYGYKPSNDEKENAEAAQEVKEMTELEQSLAQQPASEEKPKRKRKTAHAAKGE